MMIYNPARERALKAASLTPEQVRAGAPGGFFTGSLTAIPQGVAAGAYQTSGLLYGAAGSLVRGYNQVLEWQDNLARMAGLPESGKISTEWLDAQRDNALNLAQSYKPDPLRTGMAGHILFDLSRIMTQVGIGGVAAAATGGTGAAALWSGAATTGSSTMYGKYAELKKEGVDDKTALQVATIEGLVTGGGVMVPASIGYRLGANIAYGAGANIAMGVAERGTVHELLKDNYPAMAAHYQPLDTAALIAEGALGAIFGAVGARAGLHHKAQEIADAALVARDAKHAAIDTAPGIPADPKTANAHARALNTAIEQILNGEPVDVSGSGVTDGNFVPNPRETAPNVDIKETIKTQLDAIGRLDPEVNEANASLIANYYAVQAERLGMTPEALFERYPLRVVGEGEGGAALEQSLATQPPEGWKHSTDGGDAAAMWNGTEKAESVFWTELQGKLENDAPELAGYSHSIGQSAIAHIRTSHGDPKTETPRGQVAITSEDIARIPDIVTSYDAVRTDLQSHKGAPVVAYAKRVDDGVLVYLEEVSRKRRNMGAVSLRKYSPTVDTKRVLEKSIFPDLYVRNGMQTSPRSRGNDSTGGQRYDQTAWHGSPHRGIEKEGFKLHKIGTGEGAQAYGYGIYFAENRKVAEGYRDAISTNRGEDATVNGRPLLEVYQSLENEALRSFDPVAQEKPLLLEELMLGRTPQDVIKFAQENGFDPRTIQWFEGEIVPNFKQNGQLYSANIPENHELLHWDKPLSEQPKNVRVAVQKILDDLPDEMRWMAEGIDGESKGQGIYGSISDIATELENYKNPDGDGVGNHEQAGSELLRKHGVPGLRYLDGSSRGNGKDTHNYVIWDEARLNDDIKTYYQGGQNSAFPRGHFTPSTNTIALLKNADPSTFLHESGHFFLEMQADLATRADTPAAIKADMQTVLDWFGVKDLAEWQGLSTEQKRAHHEQYARGFEAYMAEGKSPSPGMQGVFERFREWLLNVYRDLKNLNVELTPEVRGVFDRMLATDSQLAEANRLAAGRDANARVRELLALDDTSPDLFRSLTAQARADLAQHFARAGETKPRFDAALGRIAEETGAILHTAPIKGVARAVDKILDDYAGDASRIKDLVRATLIVKDTAQLEQVLQRVRKVLGGNEKRNGLQNEADVSAEGYRDVLFNAELDGFPVELQISTPEMMAAKKQAHPLYVKQSEIERRAKSQGREMTESEFAESEALKAQQREIYEPAWEATKARNAASSLGAPFQSNDLNGNSLPPGTSQATGQPRGVLDTGISSTSANRVPSGNESGSSMTGITEPPEGILPLTARRAGDDAETRAGLAALEEKGDMTVSVELDDGEVVHVSLQDALREADTEAAYLRPDTMDAAVVCGLRRG